MFQDYVCEIRDFRFLLGPSIFQIVQQSTLDGLYNVFNDISNRDLLQTDSFNEKDI